METQKIKTFLWFDNQAEEAANFYISVFRNGKIDNVNIFSDGKGGAGTKVVEFTLFGQQYVGMDAGPTFKFNEAISLFVSCESQKEVDEYWAKLTANGGKESECGWLKDKYGLSWQIVPSKMMELMGGADKTKSARAFSAMMKMSKIDLQKIEDAYNGK